MINRRFLLVSGAAVAVVTAAGGGWGLTRDPSAARRPWKVAEAGQDDPLLACLSYAVLAPNPHNMQPWRIHVLSETEFEIYPNPDRMLPHTDPPSRQITIGMGCFLEVFRLAAAQLGYPISWEPFPEGENAEGLNPDQPVARVRLRDDQRVAVDPLFAQVLNRRTNRALFDLDQPVDAAHIAALVEAAATEGCRLAGTVDAAEVAELRDLTSRAWSIEWNNAATRQESIDVTRIGKAEINADPWGLSLAGPLMEGLNLAGILTRKTMGDPSSQAYVDSERFYDAACQTAMGHLWMVTDTNTRTDQLMAGMAWVRAHLKATELGLGFHPLSQALQEFPQMAEPYAEAHQRLAPEGGTVQMLVRLGYATSPPPAPREALEAKLVAI